MPDVARRLDVRATRSSGRAGEPESFCGRTLGRPLEWAACLPKRGEFEARTMGARTEEMEGGARRHRRIDENTTLVWMRQTFQRERNGATLRVDGLPLNRLTAALSLETG